MGVIPAMTEADGMAFVVDDFLPCGSIFRLRLPVGAASLLRNIALNSPPNAS